MSNLKTLKYALLADYLKGSRLEQDVLTLTFVQIEGVIGLKLPASARKYSAWWANESDGSHVQAQAWLSAGWRVIALNLSAEAVTFGVRAHE